MHPWTLDPVTGAPLLPFTTFSICMVHRMSGGKLDLFARGLTAIKGIKPVSVCGGGRGGGEGERLTSIKGFKPVCVCRGGRGSDAPLLWLLAVMPPYSA